MKYSVDMVARDKQRDVLYLDFMRDTSEYDYTNFAPRKELLDWLDRKFIKSAMEYIGIRALYPKHQTTQAYKEHTMKRIHSINY